MNFFHLIILTIIIVSCESTLDIKFKFYGDNYKDVKIIKYGEDISQIVGTKYFNPQRGSVFITHGYSFYLQARGAKPLIEAHIKNEDDINVVYIEWTTYTNKKSVLNHEIFEGVARAVYESLSAIKKKSNDFSNVHFLAFGIGSHLFGYVSRFFNEYENFIISRLTCLDPSGENFEKVYGFWIPELKPVDPSCAQFVDAIHTNAGSLGDDAPCGDVDFYVNNGIKQPLCTNPWQLAYFLLFDVQMLIGCDHQFSWIIYTESMERKPSSPAFLARKCSIIFKKGEPMNFRDECQQETSVSMGHYAKATVSDESMYGCYHVLTNDVEPFSKN